MYIKLGKDFIDDPHIYFIFVELLEEVVSREEYVVLARESSRNPAQTPVDTKSPPLLFGHQMGLGYLFRNFSG